MRALATPAPAALALLALALLVVPVTVATPVTGTESGVRIVAVAPNPSASGDPGEWIAVALPGPTNLTGWTVADGETVARLPNRTLEGRVILTTDPSVVAARLEREGSSGPNVTLVGLEGRLALANAGETVVLGDGSTRLDAVTYRDAPDGERYVRTDTGWTWRRPGVTHRPPVSVTGVPATVFVLPDAPDQPVAALEDADRRIWIGAYTFSSHRVARRLCAARRRGVDVRVLVEREPVGGMARRSVEAIDRLVDCGVTVSAIGGPGDRYAVHHPKYAVVDDRALVLSENWKPAGTGGRSSRGWGVRLDSPRAADALAETFLADAGFRDVAPWSRVRADLEPAEEPAANGSFPSRLSPESVDVDRVTLVAAPDNAEGELLSLIDGADSSVDVQQVAIGGRDDPLLNATVEAARRGVAVRILLSSAWYVREDNRRLVGWLEGLARREGLSLRARLVQPRSRFEKTHTKGLIVDGESVVVGSLNWNRHATRENREVAVVLHDREAAAYYGRAFEADWRGGLWRLPLGFGGVAAATALGAAGHRYRRARFERSRGEEPPDYVAP